MSATATSPSPVSIEGDTLTIAELSFTDPLVASHLEALPEEQRGSELIRAIGIGMHGLAASSMRATVDEMQQQVTRIITAAASDAETRLGKSLNSGCDELAAHLDPEVRSSLTARAVAEIDELHQATLARLDPDRNDSHTAKLVAAISELLGPGGMLASRLEEAFDSAEADNGLGKLRDTFERRFQEMRDLLVGEQHRREEAERGTAKGIEFEDELEEVLRSEARAISGCIVERTGQQGGTLGVQAKVGDFVVSLPDGVRVVVEAKNTARIGLGGATGILAELDEAMNNRKADWSVCVSRSDSFPTEVGSFAVYGNRLLVVDPGDGTLTRVALRWINAAVRASGAGDAEIDSATALAQLERIKGLAQSFSRSKKVLAGAQSGINTVREELDSLRAELLDLVDDAVRSLHPPASTNRQVA